MPPKPSVLLVRAAGVLLSLTLALALLKGAGLSRRVAEWSWWSVTALLWGPWAAVVMLVVLGIAWSLFVVLVRRAR